MDLSRLVLRGKTPALVLSGLLACSLMLVPAAPAKSSASKAVAKDFLPPVASINPRIDTSTPDDPDDLETVTFTPDKPATGPIASLMLETSQSKALKTGVSKSFISDDAQALQKLKQVTSESDLDRLWAATVQKNPVIRFSLEKISMPADLQGSHSSQFLKKVLSASVSGGVLAAQMLTPGGGYQNMGYSVVGQGVQNILNGRNKPSGVQLTDTEKIQMQALIDELKGRLITSYQNYTNTLQLLASSHQSTVAANNTYSKALASKKDLSIMAAGASYYKALQAETTLRQRAKLYRLQLERLAGETAVDELALSPQLSDRVADTTAYHTPVADVAPATSVAPEPFVGPEPVIGPELPEPMEIGPKLGRPTSALPNALPAVADQSAQSPKAPQKLSQKSASDDFPPMDDMIIKGGV